MGEKPGGVGVWIDSVGTGILVGVDAGVAPGLFLFGMVQAESSRKSSIKTKDKRIDFLGFISSPLVISFFYPHSYCIQIVRNENAPKVTGHGGLHQPSTQSIHEHFEGMENKKGEQTMLAR